MRERKTNGKAELNTLNFLRELNQRCDEGKLTAVTWLSDKYELSHNTGAACKDLNLIVFEEGIYKWVPKAEPSRVMALNILDNLLHRSKRKVDPPALPDMGAIDRLIQRIDVLTVQNEKGVKGRLLGRALPQSPMESNTLFSASESKEATRKDFLKSVISALYSGKSANEITDDFIQATDTAAFRVTDDVINRLYAVK